MSRRRAAEVCLSLEEGYSASLQVFGSSQLPRLIAQHNQHAKHGNTMTTSVAELTFDDTLLDLCFTSDCSHAC